MNEEMLFLVYEVSLMHQHSTHHGRWTQAITRPMQRARQSASCDLRTRRGKEGTVFEWRIVEQMPQVCIA